MNIYLNRDRLLVCGVALCGVMLAGCSSKPAPPAEVASQPAQTVEQHAQEKVRVLQTIRSMTPEQRAAYFKAHPQDVTALAQ